MAHRVTHPGALFAWLHDHRLRYAVLRGLEPDATDIDVLVDDDVVAAVRAYLTDNADGSGVKINLYSCRGTGRAGYHGFPHLPVALGRRILDGRRVAPEGAYVGQPADHWFALAYHAIYHKCAQSGLDWSDASASTGHHALVAAGKVAGIDCPPTLRALHETLVGAGLGVTYGRLARYLQHDFAHGRKNWFHAHLLAGLAGEMNLYVIREVALRHRRVAQLLERLGARFEILAVKPVGWLDSVRAARHMRGGKWRRGGRPRVAVVVFDRNPVPTTAAEQRVHPFVFNASQFAKVTWREWFAHDTAVGAKHNPVHSTDNEAEAIGHLPLFFSASERRGILDAVAVMRGAGGLEIGADAGA